ncbi:DUF732 domain-containing protein [Mycobacterium celatum]|uniref:DUF732 domain-containing protein n=1 Tax=Mycobacterium celatum TaxID=28045 RepID=A0A1X1RUG8_MYCCE|nr:DUF732 domain-containing protein [Mycobacterium celatum]ORV17883.1 hypothetical protein AWB95_06050 [Mycobacterium celatum]PIB74155.1 DUF732 domain-containing protein [Mycobacterium celatum]
MLTGITSRAGTLVTTIVVLTGAAVLHADVAGADPNQDDQFLALLDKEEIPALANVPSIIATAHKVCRKLDGGVPVDDVVDTMTDNAYGVDPLLRLYPPARVTSTVTRFITAAVEVYCPDDQGKIASIMANPEPGSGEPTHRLGAYTRNAANSGNDALEPTDGGVFLAGRYRSDRSDGYADDTVLTSLTAAVPSGEITPPNPPQIPTPPPPAAHKPQQQPPPPQQVEPPAAAPQPGDAAGSGGGGSGGGNGNGGSGPVPAEPSPEPPIPPGFVRLAP